MPEASVAASDDATSYMTIMWCLWLAAVQPLTDHVDTSAFTFDKDDVKFTVERQHDINDD